MSTRCLIGKVEKNGKIKTVYCHHDGYPEGVGTTLNNFYDETNIDKLLDLGDLSVLGAKPQTVAEYWTSNDTDVQYKALSGEYCISYKDRGEANIDAKEYSSYHDCYTAAKDCWAEFLYLLINGKWFVSDTSDDDTEPNLISVEDAIKKGY